MKTLTLIEYRVATMLAEGLTTSEIAAAVDGARDTVKQHLGRIYFKLGFAGVRYNGQAVGQRLKLIKWRIEHDYKTLEEFAEYQRSGALRAYFEYLFVVASTPIKFPSPSRRRRQDREIPKAA